MVINSFLIIHFRQARFFFSYPLKTSEYQSVPDILKWFEGRRGIVQRWVKVIKISIIGVMLLSNRGRKALQ